MASAQELLSMGFSIEGDTPSPMLASGNNAQDLLNSGYSIEGVDTSPPQVDNTGGIVIPINAQKRPLTFGESMAGQAVDLADKMSLVGIGDEAIAGGAALADQLPGFLGGTGASLSDAYDSRLAQTRDLQKRYQEENPWASLAGYATNLKAPIKVLGGINKAKGVIPAVGNIAKSAGTFGALGAGYGFGSGEGGMENRAENAYENAAVGAAMGGTLQGLAELAQGGSRLLSGGAKGIRQELVGFNPEKADKIAGRVDAKGKITSDQSKQVANIGNKELRFNQLEEAGFPKLISATDSPKDVSEKLSKFRQSTGNEIGNVVDELAAAEQKLIGKANTPQAIINAGTKELPARAFVTQGNKAGAAVESIAPDFKNAANYVDEISSVKPDIGASLGKELEEIKTAWNNSDQSLSALKNIQQKFGLINKKVFSAADTYAVRLRNEIYGALRQAVSNRVKTTAQAIGKPELAARFEKAMSGYSGAVTFEESAFNAANKKISTKLKKTIFSFPGVVRGFGLASSGPFAPLFAAESGYSVFKDVAPAALNKVLGAGSKTLGAAAKLNPVEAGTAGRATLFNLNKRDQQKEEPTKLVGKGVKKMDKPEEVAAATAEIKADPYLNALAMHESNWKPKSTNDKSTAKGLFQFIDDTARRVGLADPFSIPQSLKAIKILTDDHRKKFGNDPEMLYAAHYLGAGVLNKLLKNQPLDKEEREHATFLIETLLPRFRKTYAEVNNKDIKVT